MQLLSENRPLEPTTLDREGLKTLPIRVDAKITTSPAWKMACLAW